jgi:lactate permease
LFLLAASPVLLLIALLLILRWPLLKAAPTTFVYTAIIAVGAWGLPATYLGSALLKGFLLTLDIGLIVFGAIFFLGYLRQMGALVRMEKELLALTSDRRLQAILLAWPFGGFIEGVSGFGTPAVIVAPLLVGIGFGPLTAILVALVANSTAVAFGAVGTPIRIGFSGLETSGVAFHSALINLVAGLSVPLMILALVTKSESGSRVGSFISLLPWTLFAGFAFLIPYTLLSMVGYEFPSIFGGAIGLVVTIASLRFGFLVPSAGNSNIKAMIRAFAPYILLLGLLILGKFAFISQQVSLNLGGGLSHSVQFFNPGFAFLTTALLMTLYLKRPIRELVGLAGSTMTPLRKAVVSIFFITSFTYTMIATGSHDPDRAGILQSLADMIVTPALPYYSSFIGAFGAFLAGSATVSNLLFGSMQAIAAESIGFPVSWILALQLVGAGAGNMIALPNLLAVQAAVGLEAREPELLLRLITPCLIYLVLATLAGAVFSL